MDSMDSAHLNLDPKFLGHRAHLLVANDGRLNNTAVILCIASSSALRSHELAVEPYNGFDADGTMVE